MKCERGIKEMKKVIINNEFDVTLTEASVPVPKAGELLVKTELSGISSGTEMMLYTGTYPNLKTKKYANWKQYPIYPGYEVVGKVVAIGENIEIDTEGKKQIEALGQTSEIIIGSEKEFKVGDRVFCLGEHAEYVCVPAVLAAKLPDSISSEEATLVALTTTAQHCTRRASVQYGDIVAIIGAGVLGYLCVQHAKNCGASRVITVDINDKRLAYAKAAGSDIIINPDKENPAVVIKEKCRILADVVIDTSGSNGIVGLALNMLRERGRIVLLGWHTDSVIFPFEDFYFKEATIIASAAIGPEPGLPYSYVRWGSDQGIRWSVELIEKGIISGKHFKPNIFNCNQIKQVYDMIYKKDPKIGLQCILAW